MKRLTAIAAVLTIMFAIPCIAGAEDAKDKDAAEKQIRALAEKFVTAFNEGDAEAIVKLFTPNGDYVGPRGETLTGRQEIQKRFEEFFSLNPGVRLKTTIRSIRLIGPTVAVLDTRPKVTPPLQGPPAEAHGTIILVRQGKRWMVESVRDTMVPVPSNYDHLKQLEWMIGEWVDASSDSEGVSVQSSCDWTANKNYLLRKYSVVLGDRIARTGTQLIGWDPRENRIRSWIFDTSGGFTEGFWKRDGNRWIVATSGVLQDGSEVSGINTITLIDGNTFTFESTDRLLDGRPDPDIQPIEVRRVVQESAATDADDPSQPARRETVLPD